MTGEGHTRTDPSDRVLVERDGVTCTLCGRTDGLAATPAGPMCPEHAANLAAHYKER